MNTKIQKVLATTASAVMLLGLSPLSAFAAVPSISGISPSSIVVGSSAIALTVYGTNFDSSSMVYFNGTARSTSLVSSNQVTAVIPASDLNMAGTFSVSVWNSGAGGGTSNAVAFMVIGSNNPVPTMTGMSPTSRVVGSGGITLSVYGTNFIPGSVVRYNGITHATTYVSTTQLNATISASDVSTTGLYLVDVITPTPGGGASNGMLFTVTPLTSTTPTLPNTGFGPESTIPSVAVALAIVAATAIIGLGFSLRKVWSKAT